MTKTIVRVLASGAVVLKGEPSVKKMATAAKVVNYTPEQTASVIEQYLSGVTVETIATALGKSTRSIVAKLSRELKGTENEYKAKTYKTKTGEAVAKKDDLADKIGELLGASANDTDSLTKVNKTMLKLILDRLEYSKENSMD